MIGHLKVFADVYHCATYYSVADISAQHNYQAKTNNAGDLCMPVIITELNLNN